MPDPHEVIAQMGGVIENLNAQVEALERERDEARRLIVELAWALEPVGDGGQMRRDWKNRLFALDWFLPLTDAMEMDNG